MAENNRAKVLWESDFQTDKQLLANQPDIVVIVKDCTCGSPGAQPHQKEEVRENRKAPGVCEVQPIRKKGSFKRRGPQPKES